MVLHTRVLDKTCLYMYMYINGHTLYLNLAVHTYMYIVGPQRRVDLCSLRSLTRVPSIGLARMCRVPSQLKYGDHAMESLSNDAL